MVYNTLSYHSITGPSPVRLPAREQVHDGVGRGGAHAIYIYICMCVCVYIYIYIYTYIHVL